MEAVGQAVLDPFVTGVQIMFVLAAVLVACKTIPAAFGGAGEEERSFRGWAVAGMKALIPPALVVLGGLAVPLIPGITG